MITRKRKGQIKQNFPDKPMKIKSVSRPPRVPLQKCSILNLLESKVRTSFEIEVNYNLS